MKTIVYSARTRIRRRSLRRGFPPSRSYSAAGLLIPLLLVCFALAPMAQAVGPDTDGSIPGANNGEGVGVLVNLTSGVWNTGTGFEALNHDTGGKNNTATGVRALFSDGNGSNNTATGVYALYSNTTGWYNNAVGAYALSHNTTASWNTANGYGALYSNTTGVDNTATGFAALYNNTIGVNNVANGLQALYSNTTGIENTAVGVNALAGNTNGSANTAIGLGALFNSASGDNNTAVGVSALAGTTGNNNTAIGPYALHGNITGNNNTAVGRFAGESVFTADNVICIGADVAGADVSDSCFIGNIYGVNEGGTISAVYINSNGQLGTQPSPSSRRFKKEIKPMDQTSEAILALKPVTFQYKSDKTGTPPQFGLIAEDVAQVSPDLVVRDENGDIYSVRYDAVNAMLLNEFLKEHRKVEEQQATITQLKKEMEMFAARLKEQDSKIQKVSAQIAVGKPLPQTVLNNQ
jgi:hypothetical protein